MPVWFIPTMLGFFGLMFLLFGFWLWMFIHCLTTPIEDKLLWGVVILFAGPLGAILYYFIVKRRH
ncbi:MAG: PLDc N-terminal domain-containing protein [Deltaproteobacteria bacterium]|nr:PLDc N-terminal domain-containing protein [Deltaproteobacteria bacterium]